jgi:hypothetical protein
VLHQVYKDESYVWSTAALVTRVAQAEPFSVAKFATIEGFRPIVARNVSFETKRFVSKRV